MKKIIVLSLVLLLIFIFGFIFGTVVSNWNFFFYRIVEEATEKAFAMFNLSYIPESAVINETLTLSQQFKKYKEVTLPCQKDDSFSQRKDAAQP